MLAEIRAAIQKLQDKAKGIEPDAIIEALETMSQPDRVKKNNVVFSDDNAKIVLQFRKQYENSTEVDRITEDIQREYQRLSQESLDERQKLQQYIDELNSLVAEATQKQENLLTSPYLENLKRQLAIARSKTENKVAILAVHVKDKF